VHDSGAEYDGTTCHFLYKRLVRTSDVALFKILTSALLLAATGNSTESTGNSTESTEGGSSKQFFTRAAMRELVDHWVALRIVLLSSVVRTSWHGPGPNSRVTHRTRVRGHRQALGPKGWASGWTQDCDVGAISVGGGARKGLVSTEATLLATLALGACCSFAFEV
jgi:hypothetical protein